MLFLDYWKKITTEDCKDSDGGYEEQEIIDVDRAELTLVRETVGRIGKK
jgi:hypothetical protein